MNPEHSEALDQSRNERIARLRPDPAPLLTGSADEVARRALRESRLRGLPAAEEYRVISDRLYRAGVRDMPPGALVRWIEEAVALEYESFLELRALGDRVNAALAGEDLAAATWELVCRLSPEARKRIISGARKLDELERGER